MKNFENKKIYIAPKTPISISFKEYLLNEINYEFLGYLDKVKEEEDVLKVEKIVDKDFDFIIIISPNHDNAIYQEYIKIIDSKKIKIVKIENNYYNLQDKVIDIKDSIIEELSKEIDTNNIKRETVAFICKGFIDSNNKYLYLYLLKNGIKSYIVTDNKSQINELKEYNLPYFELGTNEGDRAIANAKYLVFDQANHTYFYKSPNQKTIQLWHGVGLKKMAKLTNIEYDYFVSTSDWTNETNFRNVFCAKEYFNCGYPRNDIFFKIEEKEDMIFCDKEIFSFVKNKQFEKVVLYMPTIREYFFNKNINLDKKDILPIDFYKLNDDLAKNDFMFIIKFHPHVMEFFKEFIITEQFSNIKFYTTQGDIYPVIKYIDILVTDYSSIAYDFLLLDRPIIFFDYDRKTYENNMGGFLFDYDKYSPGIKANNQEELTKALFLADIYKEQRECVKNIFFDKNEQLASKNILDKIFLNN